MGPKYGWNSLIKVYPKYNTMVEVTDSGEPTRLLHRNINYDPNKFYSAGTGMTLT